MGRRERNTDPAFQTLVTDIGVLLTEEEAALFCRTFLRLSFFISLHFTTCDDNENRKKYTPVKMQFLRGEQE